MTTRRAALAAPFLLPLFLACSAAPPAAPAKKPETRPAAPIATATAAPEPPLATLRTGKLAPIAGEALDAPVVARFATADTEYFELEQPVVMVGNLSISVFGPRVFMTLDGPGLVVSAMQRAGSSHLWVRRPRAASLPVVSIYTDALPFRDYEVAPGAVVRVNAKVTPLTRTDAKLPTAYLEAVADSFSDRRGAFFRFAADRLRSRAATPPANRDGWQPRADLARLMDTFSGRLSVQEALQEHRGLYVQKAREKQSVPIAQVRVPRLTQHPWVAMKKQLRLAGANEPLAKVTPADFYFVRARSLNALLDVVDAVDDWGTAAADLLDGRAEDRGTFTRYQTELGIERTGFARAFGPELVEELAIVGSDPYLHEGTDVTLLMRAKSAALGTALGILLQKVAASHGGVTETEFEHAGVEVTVRRSTDGRVRQHRASLPGIEIVSNSPGAIKRVLSAVKGDAPQLADEPDFAYMLARDAGAPDAVLGYMGDRFVANVVGPVQKIAEARRQIAISELSTPGFAALLSGYVDGKSPASKAELLRSKWLTAEDLKHADKSPIEWEPGTAARSRWGTLDALEPLIDGPPLTRVTPSEKEGYDEFASAYERLWSDKIDPIALRVVPASDGKKSTLSLDLRVLPLLRSEFREITEMAGKAMLAVPSIPSGARVVVGIGKDARLRHELTRSSRSFGFGDKSLGFDWLGDYALVGAANRNEAANVVHQILGEQLEPPGPEPTERRRRSEAEWLANLPVYAAIGVKSRVGAGVAIAALRKLVESSLPGTRWEAPATYRGQEVVRITVRESRAEVSLYYALLDEALVLSLNEGALHGAIDQLLDAPPVLVDQGRPTASDRGAAQLVMDLAASRGTALYQVALWLATVGVLEHTHEGVDTAEAALRGAPEAAGDPARARQIMKAYFGTVPLTPEGREYVLSPDGIRDPVRGTHHAPEWPALPVPGSPLDRVLSHLSGLRTSLAFDDEPGGTPEAPLQSLHATVKFETPTQVP